MKKDKKLMWTSILTAVGASLCCITPVLALISGTSGIAATFSWLEPLRPYLIGITILVLGFAWYQKLKPKNEIDCDCETDEKPKFLQSKTFLGLVTGFAIVMLAFPYYGSVFYPETEKELIIVDRANIQKINFGIDGLTCTSCEDHVNHSVNQLDGILNINSSFEKGNAIIEFDKSITTTREIEIAINSTGYTVTGIKEE